MANDPTPETTPESAPEATTTNAMPVITPETTPEVTPEAITEAAVGTEAATKSTAAKSASKAAGKKPASKKTTTSKSAKAKTEKNGSGSTAKSKSGSRPKTAATTEESKVEKESPAVAQTNAETTNADNAKPEKPATKKSSSKKKINFKVGQDVVYPLQGVGKIVEQIRRDFKSEEIDYYTIYIDATDMTVMLPVEKVQELGLRPIVPKADAEQALKSMSDKNEPLTSDWKLRYQNNLDLIKEGGVMDIATVVRSLYHRSKVKELPILERKLYDNALKLMVDEISLALERAKEEIEDLLHTRLENSNS